MVPSFAQLLVEGEGADLHQDASWLIGRAWWQRPNWDYEEVLGAWLGRVDSALCLDNGDLAFLADLPHLPDHLVVSSRKGATDAELVHRLEDRGAWIVESAEVAIPPVAGESFELVASRDLGSVPWADVARLLHPGGSYVGQLLAPVGVLGAVRRRREPEPTSPRSRSLEAQIRHIHEVGLEIVDVRQERLRLEFRDIATVVFAVRRLVSWIPDFSVERYAARLATLHEQIVREGAFVTYLTLAFVEAVKPVE